MSDVVLDSLNSAKHYLPKLRDGFSRISMYFRNGKDFEGIQLFTQAIEGLDWFLHVAEAISTFYGSEEKLTYINDELGTISDIIMTLSQAWGNRDYLLTADIIDYEMIPNLEKWNSLIEKLVTNSNLSE